MKRLDPRTVHEAFREGVIEAIVALHFQRSINPDEARSMAVDLGNNLVKLVAKWDKEDGL